MKVLDLQCGQLHSFEGWFASEGDFQSQLARGLVECPICADKVVLKLPSAPRLNLGNARAPEASANDPQAQIENPQTHSDTDLAGSGAGTAAVSALLPTAPNAAEQAVFLQALRQVIANTQDVGKRFADEARAMHYGESEARSIRGQTTAREAVELMEEGIEVLPLPMLEAVKHTLQ